MNLRHIKTTACPHCSTQCVSYEQVDVDYVNRQYLYYANDERGEVREFACGYRISYIPQFSQEESTSMCRDSQAYRTRVEKREAARDAVMKYIDTLDVDEVYREGLKRWLYQ